MEAYAHGLRNIYDVAIDPFMNLFTRGNTNDGGYWNKRFIHEVKLVSMDIQRSSNDTLVRSFALVDVGMVRELVQCFSKNPDGRTSTMMFP